MSTFRTRNKLFNTLDNYSFNSLSNSNRLNLTTFKVNKKKKNILKNSYNNIIEYNAEVKKITLKNKLLKEEISFLSIENFNLKNIMKKIIAFNKEKTNKNYIKTFMEEYYQQLIFNKKKLKIHVDKVLNDYKKIEDEVNNKTSDLIIAKDELERTKFLLENSIQKKDNFISIYLSNLKKIGTVQENERFRYLNDELYQNDIDNFYGKFLDIYQRNLLLTSQRWNKSKNKVSKCTEEIEDLKKILDNPGEYINSIANKDEIKKNNSNNIITENDKEIFLMTFDEFEDDFEPDINEDDDDDLINIDNNIDINSNINNKINIKEKPKFNKINKININNFSKNVLKRDANKKNNIKNELYYFPQKNLSNSIIKEKINSTDINSNRIVSINNIAKLNLNQIIFNKNLKYMKEEANDLALKRYEIENEFEMSSNNANKREEMKIKDLKNDIKIFKNKINKKKKIIKNFKSFYDDFMSKYQNYINSNE